MAQPRSQVAYSYVNDFRPFTLVRQSSPDDLLPVQLSCELKRCYDETLMLGQSNL